MNLVSARTSLRKKIGNPSVANVADTVLTDVLNTAQSFITSRYPFNQTRKIVIIPTVIAQDTYVLPIDLLSIRRVWDDTNKKKLQRRGLRFLSSLPLTGFDPGFAKYYIHDGLTIQILPQANAVVNIKVSYIGQPILLALDTDLPIFSESWHDGWVLKARHIYYDQQGDVGKAIYARNEWKDWVADKPSEIDSEKDDLDDGAIELPELSRGLLRRDLRYDPTFDTEDNR